MSAVKIIRKSGSVKDGIKILDIGSGEGFFKFFFDAKCSENIEWYGIETWKERFEFCKHLGYNMIDLDLDGGEIPLPDGEFDIVLASHVIEHLHNPTAIIKEMGRVLKKDGILLIATPTKLPGIAELDGWWHRMRNRKTGDTQQAFTHYSLESMILKTLAWPKSSVIDKRGFRIFSSRKKLPLENWNWFYKGSVWLGRKLLLLLVPEVNIILKKNK